MKRLAKVGIFLATLSLPWPAAAQTGNAVGRIAYVRLYQEAPARTVVFLEGDPEMCGSGGPQTALIEVTANNYDAVVAGLLTAYSLQRKVQIYATRINNNCIITSVELQPS